MTARAQSGSAHDPMLLAKPPSFRRLISRLTRRAGDLPEWLADKPSDQETLPSLAEAIEGRDKSTIATALGPPRGAVIEGLSSTSSFWEADTWYYLVPRQERMAMAVRFEKDRARQVDFFQARAA